MNLHEECLLKYLINPLDLFYTTELLKLNNDLINENNQTLNGRHSSNRKITYKTGQII